MNTFAFGRYALSGCAAATLLAGCTLSQPGSMPGTSAQHKTTSAQYKVLLRFKGGVNGEHPRSGLIAVNGRLYGTTYGGGAKQHCSKCGVVYSVSASGAEKVLHDFTGYPSDGAFPLGDLLDVNGIMYGTTFAGGAGFTGTLYRVSPSGKEQVLESFAYYGTDNRGLNPAAGPIDVNGTLYGTTEKGCGPSQSAQCGPGSSESNGVVYSADTTGKIKAIYSFSHGGGAYPEAPVVNVSGTLYGTTENGPTTTTASSIALIARATRSRCYILSPAVPTANIRSPGCST